jgi:hypothetical protein
MSSHEDVDMGVSEKEARVRFPSMVGVWNLSGIDAVSGWGVSTEAVRLLLGLRDMGGGE